MAKHRIPLPSIKTMLIIIVVAVYALTLTSLIVSVIDGESPLRLPTIGNIIAVGYQAYGGDIVTTAGNQSIDWGTVYVGTSTNRTFTLKSKSTTITTPQLNTTDWTFRNQQNQPVASPAVNDITVNWTLDSTQLAPNQEANVTLTLTVKYDSTFVEYLIDNSVRTFSFDIVIEPS